MGGYTKLFSSIIASTIWSANDHTRIVWITMLAMANRHGIVEASLPGLAVLARVPENLCREAIHALEGPDPDSRTSTQEGRRIAKVEGGWQIINYETYRRKLSAEERREYKTMKQREYRNRATVDTAVDTLSTSGQNGHIAEAEAEAEAKANSKTTPTPLRPEARESTPFETFWPRYPRPRNKKAARRAWNRLTESQRKLALEALEKFKASLEWRRERGRFVPYAQKFLNEELYLESPTGGAPSGLSFDERVKRATEKKT